MASRYDQIRARSLEDPGTAGDEGEEIWAKLLRAWLPRNYEVITKGRILFSNGEASPQFDVFVLSPSYPVGLIENRPKLYLAAGVLAAFECKNTLRLTHVGAAVERSAALQRLARADKSVGQGIVFGLLAHAHDIRSTSPQQSVTKALQRADARLVVDPRECIDFICIASLGTWALMRFLEEFHGEAEPGRVSVTYMGPLDDDAFPGRGQAIPIGRLLTGLLRRLSPADSTLRSIGAYFQSAGLFGIGQGVPRRFDLAEMPPDIRQNIY